MLIRNINIKDFLNYIPLLFDYMNDKEISAFYSVINDILDKNDIKNQKDLWKTKVLPFLQLRIKNKPCTLKLNEISSIIELAPCLDFAFSQYVDLLEKLPSIKISKDNMFIFSLSQESESYKKFDLNSLGRFLLILLNHCDQYNLGIFYGINDLYPKISPNLPPEIDTKIRARAKELAIEIGV